MRKALEATGVEFTNGKRPEGEVAGVNIRRTDNAEILRKGGLGNQWL
jgi:hypothetical protein